MWLTLTSHSIGRFTSGLLGALELGGKGLCFIVCHRCLSASCRRPEKYSSALPLWARVPAQGSDCPRTGYRPQEPRLCVALALSHGTAGAHRKGMS